MNRRDFTPSGDALRVSRKATREDTRHQNRRFVLQCLFSNAPTTRADISRATGLTRATVSDLVAELVAEGLVLELGTAPSGGGKPPTLLTVSDDAFRLRNRLVGTMNDLDRIAFELVTELTWHFGFQRGVMVASRFQLGLPA